MIETRSVVRLGELLAKIEKRATKHSKGGGSKGSQRAPLPDAPPTLSDLGVSKKLSHVAQLAARQRHAARFGRARPG